MGRYTVKGLGAAELNPRPGPYFYMLGVEITLLLLKVKLGGCCFVVIKVPNMRFKNSAAMPLPKLSYSKFHNFCCEQLHVLTVLFLYTSANQKKNAANQVTAQL